MGRSALSLDHLAARARDRLFGPDHDRRLVVPAHDSRTATSRKGRCACVLGRVSAALPLVSVRSYGLRDFGCGEPDRRADRCQRSAVLAYLSGAFVTLGLRTTNPRSGQQHPVTGKYLLGGLKPSVVVPEASLSALS